MSKTTNSPPIDEEEPFDYDHGFLSKQQRRYLAGVDDLSGHSNIYGWRGRVRERYRASLMDLALLSQAPEDVIDAEYLQGAVNEQENGYNLYLQDEMIAAGVGSSNALARTYGNNPLIDLVGEMNETAKKARETQEITQEFMVKAIIRVLAEGEPEFDQVSRFIESFWPDKETVLKIAEREWDAE